jgi:hypothetical protein
MEVRTVIEFMLCGGTSLDKDVSDREREGNCKVIMRNGKGIVCVERVVANADAIG